jgi:type III secretion system low calcium response chaperone LcrH/SycD
MGEGIEEKLREHFKQSPLGARRLVERFEGIGDEHLEAAYGIGIQLMEGKRYVDAESVFYFLVTMDHYEGKYWKALGKVQEKGKKYREAMGSYLGAYFLDPMDIEVVWSMGECCILLGEREGAKGFMEQVCAIYEEEGKRKDLARRAQGILEMMGKEGGGK